MPQNATELRRALARIRRHPSGRGHRYPAELRAAVAAHVCRCRDRGESWAALTRDLGLSTFTLQRWVEASRRDTFRPVEVAAPAESPAASAGPVVVLPGGVRIEGLDLAGLTALVRALR